MALGAALAGAPGGEADGRLAGVTIAYMALYKAAQVVQTGFLWDKLPLHACNLAAVLALPAALAGNRGWAQPLPGVLLLWGRHLLPGGHGHARAGV